MDSDAKPSQEVRLYAFGSCEVDQFLVVKKDAEGKEHEYRDATQSKIAIDLTNFITRHSLSIHSVACGALHTLILTTTGRVFSFGCNDEGALGREGDEKVPLPIDFPHPIDMISAGDSHSIACNSTNSIVYYWGIYRTTSGNMTCEAKRSPERIGQTEFSKKQITKILSGANHTLVLTEGRVYAWGDPETQVLGRMPLARRKIDQALRIEALGLKNVTDIFTGAYHSFCKVSLKIRGKAERVSEIFAWGLNNYGQLGIGNTKNTFTPTLVEAFVDKPVKKITGGEHHTIALLENGEVYAFGRDDDGQLGLGEDFREERDIVEEKPKKVVKKVVKKAKGPTSSKVGAEKAAGDEKTENTSVPGDRGEETKDDNRILEEGKAVSEVDTQNPDERALIEEPPLEVSSKAFKYVVKPHKVEIEKVKEIYSGGSFNYCITEENAVYSWGCGDQFVLGTRNEDTQYEPYRVNPKQFNEMKVLELGLGSQHVVFLAVKDPNFEKPKLDESVFKEIAPPTPVKKSTPSYRSKSKPKSKSRQVAKEKETEESQIQKRSKSAGKAPSSGKKTVIRKKKQTGKEEQKSEGKESRQTRSKSRGSTSRKKSQDKKSQEKKGKKSQSREKSAESKRVVHGRKRGAPNSNRDLENEVTEGDTIKKSKVAKGKKRSVSKR